MKVRAHSVKRSHPWKASSKAVEGRLLLSMDLPTLDDLECLPVPSEEDYVGWLCRKEEYNE